jgi:hypothetical protein
MKLTPPKKITFWISILLGVLGLVGALFPSIPVLGTYEFVLEFLAFLLLVLALFIKGL